ncbi:hypothetical protein N9V13_01340 [Betaproteobacteria bacterium]|nr:hypothetical protein [Betaproteobacteria bacterium]
MKSNIFTLIIFTISSLILFGCDQIWDRALGKINKTGSNDLTLTSEENSLKSLDGSSKESILKKSEEEKESIEEEDISSDNSKPLKKKYDVIGTNKDGPYRSGETNRIRSAK